VRFTAPVTPRLDRTVALKILPVAFSTDPDRLHRFQQEAKILSTLNHPNVLAIYDVGEQNSVRFLVSEFLEASLFAKSWPPELFRAAN